MTLPPVGPSDAAWGPTGSTGSTVNDVPDPQVATAPAEQGRGFRGGRVVAVASLAVIAVATLEAALRDRIGLWTGVTLVAVAIIAPLVTRSGDRSLPAMMPPLAFLVAVLIAGQLLVARTGDAGFHRTAEAVMLVQNLGPNAIWVVAATILSTTIAAVRHFTDR